MSWYARWNGTVEFSEKRWRDGRSRAVTKDQAKDYISNSVNDMNIHCKPVNYKQYKHTFKTH